MKADSQRVVTPFNGGVNQLVGAAKAQLSNGCSDTPLLSNIEAFWA